MEHNEEAGSASNPPTNMERAPIDQVDKNYASLKAIKLGMAISDKGFASLSESAQQYVDSHKEDCSVTPRQYKRDMWKNMTSHFINSNDIVPQLFSNTREKFKQGADLEWPKHERDIAFLCFALLKYHACKTLTQSKKRKAGNEEAEALIPSSPSEAKVSHGTETGNSEKPARGTKKKIQSKVGKNAVESTEDNDEESVKTPGTIHNTPMDEEMVDSGEEEITEEDIKNANSPVVSENAIGTTNNGDNDNGKSTVHGPQISAETAVDGQVQDVDKLNEIAQPAEGIPIREHETPVNSKGVDMPPSTAGEGSGTKLAVKTFVNGKSTGGPIIFISQPPFSVFFGNVVLNVSDVTLKVEIAKATHCQVRLSKPSTTEVSSIDLRDGEHEEQWKACLGSVGEETEAKELHADFLTSDGSG